MRVLLFTSWLLVALSAIGCPAPVPASDAGQDRDAGSSDRTSGWDHNVGYDVQFTPRDAGPGCGDVPTTGSCDDAGVLHWCEDNSAHSYDCAAIGYACAEKPSLGGCWCLAGPGQDCSNWPCRESLLCQQDRRCSGWPDAGQREAGREDADPADRGDQDAGDEDGGGAAG